MTGWDCDAWELAGIARVGNGALCVGAQDAKILPGFLATLGMTNTEARRRVPTKITDLRGHEAQAHRLKPVLPKSASGDLFWGFGEGSGDFFAEIAGFGEDFGFVDGE